ncbi:MAG: sodium ion-translocating decarboxylase subunit beta [Synergistaceae bacterium]|jgi:oxaloacetate decarboxylase beta subunit|nr:sodium ion-translocating decarboxylase subunit beta [Synergistaceae bacterium]
MEMYLKSLGDLASTSGFAELFKLNVAFGSIALPGYLLMIVISCVLLYLAIGKGFEPLLLVPIAFGALLVNLPLSGILDEAGVLGAESTGFLRYVYFGAEHEIYPIIIFLGIGALTDFGPLLANPITFLLGAAAQFGVFMAFIGANALGFNLKEAASIGIIGGADGPTSIYLTMKLGQKQILPAIAVAAYSYMSLVPLIQPPFIKLFTSKKDRAIRMAQLRPVSKKERVLFPIICTIVAGLVLPACVPLVGMLMFGNLLRECGATERLSQAAQNEILNITTVFLGLAVGSTMGAEQFLRVETLKIIFLGLVAFIFSTVGGVLFGQLMKILSNGRVNPMIGSAGVSAVPMAARVVQRVSQSENPGNYLLMHAMGPNVAGVIGTAVAAGVLLTLLTMNG